MGEILLQYNVDSLHFQMDDDHTFFVKQDKKKFHVKLSQQERTSTSSFDETECVCVHTYGFVP